MSLCSECGDTIAPSGGSGAPALTCSDSCRQKRVAERRRAKREPATCVQCDGPLPEDAHPNARTCSPECRDARGRALNDRKRARRREALGPRICQLAGCGNEISYDRDPRAKFCSDACKAARWDRTRAERDAQAAEDAAAIERGEEPVAKHHKRGTRNEQAKEDERTRRGAIRARLGTRLWEIDRAAVERWQAARSGAEPASAGAAAA